MRCIIFTLVLLTTGCSAVFANRGSPFQIQDCPTSMVPPLLDTVGAVVAGTIAVNMEVNNDLRKDHQVTLIGISSVLYGMSAYMGLSEVYECEYNRKK